MRSLFYITLSGLIAFIASACANEKQVLRDDECPQDALCLYKDISDWQNIMPNTYKASIYIKESTALRESGEIEKNIRKSITNTLNDVIKLGKKHECSGGNYTLNPNIEYKDGAAGKTKGYKLDFKLKCNIANEKKQKYDDFITHISNVVSQNTYLEFLTPSMDGTFTPEILQEIRENSFINALKLAQELQTRYSKTLGKRCILANVKKEGEYDYSHADSGKLIAYSQESNTYNLPLPEEKELTLIMKAKYICK